MTTTVTTGNNVVIPDDIAAQLGIRPGTQLDWQRANGAADSIVVKVIPDRAALAKSLFGSGRKYLKPGADPIGNLVEERAREDAERDSSL